MKVPLDQLEARLQALIEGSAARLFPMGEGRPGEPGKELASRLATAMRENLRARSDGASWAPNQFTLSVHPSQAEALGQDRGLIEALAEEIQRASTTDELIFPAPPVIKVHPDAEVGLYEVRITVSFDMEHLGKTSILEGKPIGVGRAGLSGGFLIVGGKQTYPIQDPVVNIGRGSRNDLILDDLRVSREHAQLRAIHGRYVIFDLDSTGGTFVNEQRVVQCALNPGDVISLAGVTLIFSQEAEYPGDVPSPEGETQPYPPEEG